MLDAAERDFIRDRTLEHIRTHQSTGPLLTELYPEVSPPKTPTCKVGHVRTPGRKCPACADDKPGESMIQRAIRIAQERPR